MTVDGIDCPARAIDCMNSCMLSAGTEVALGACGTCSLSVLKAALYFSKANSKSVHAASHQSSETLANHTFPKWG